MHEPCLECLNRCGHDYTEDCDDKCRYAFVCKGRKKALEIAWRYSQCDGAWHKAWVIDQMVRELLGSDEEYKQWVAKYTAPLPDGDHYNWYEGIAP